MSYDLEAALLDASILMGSAIPVIHLSQSTITKSLQTDKSTLIAKHGVQYRNLLFATSALQSERAKHDNSPEKVRQPPSDSVPCANDIEEGKQYFTSQVRSFLIPGSLLRNAADMVNITTTSMPVEVAKQLKKDIERDKLMINGQLFLGAEIGLGKVLSLLMDAMVTAINECQLPRQSPQMLEKLATIILYRTSRTISGGMAVTALQNFVDMAEYLIVPDPQATPPLSISIHVGKPTNMPSWGIVCDISCEYVYVLKNVMDCMGDNMEAPDDSTNSASSNTSLRLIYTHSVLCAVDLTEIEAVNWDLITDDPSTHTFVRVERINVKE